jgi:sec-independent protein translocase protein TatA
MQDGETDARKEQLADQRKEDADFPENKVKDKDQHGA